jgi:hypothetical protein
MTIKGIIVVALLCLATPVVRADGATLVTDATWKATELSPPPGWNDSVSFDDSSWGSAVVVYPAGQPGTRLDGDLVDGLWFDGTIDSGPTTVWFRKVFTLGSVPPSALLSIFVDDDAQVFLNGTLLIDDSNGSAG